MTMRHINGKQVNDNEVTNGGVTMSLAAARTIEATMHDPGGEIAADIAALRSGKHTREPLLAFCLDGAEADRVQGWREYVDAVVAAAGK